ncbi:hypothetical protein GPECTOR_11g297 [Gonium pectorale]|uniref:Pherophorin domain-containing protein n=1 Tax=Gonium pectorale TaxID=33097 RepID=A0A150GPV1_GONPE|nr:hypothetical protein GPECTOR_11g297 [Gonium pectorale]|eukprot:KXZ51859.1 hypothetical protein GPECTOR_11g297 [Gonium pectorale]
MYVTSTAPAYPGSYSWRADRVIMGVMGGRHGRGRGGRGRHDSRVDPDSGGSGDAGDGGDSGDGGGAVTTCLALAATGCYAPASRTPCCAALARHLRQLELAIDPSCATSLRAVTLNGRSLDDSTAILNASSPSPDGGRGGALLRISGLRLDYWSALDARLCLTLAPPCSSLADLCGSRSAAGSSYCLVSYEDRAGSASKCCNTCQVPVGGGGDSGGGDDSGEGWRWGGGRAERGGGEGGDGMLAEVEEEVVEVSGGGGSSAGGFQGREAGAGLGAEESARGSGDGAQSGGGGGTEGGGGGGGGGGGMRIVRRPKGGSVVEVRW